jgi:hypothetical protein
MEDVKITKYLKYHSLPNESDIETVHTCQNWLGPSLDFTHSLEEATQRRQATKLFDDCFEFPQVTTLPVFR